MPFYLGARTAAGLSYLRCALMGARATLAAPRAGPIYYSFLYIGACFYGNNQFDVCASSALARESCWQPYDEGFCLALRE